MKKKVELLMLAFVMTGCTVETPKEISLTVPTEILTARTSEITGDIEGLTLTMEDPTVASVYENKILANKAGTTNLVASNGSEEKKYEFTVRNPAISDEDTSVLYNYTCTMEAETTGAAAKEAILFFETGIRVSIETAVMGATFSITQDIYFDNDVAYVVEKQEDGSYAATSKYEQTPAEIKESYSLSNVYTAGDWEFSKAEKKDTSYLDTFKTDELKDTDETSGLVSSSAANVTLTFKDSLIYAVEMDVESGITTTKETASYSDVGTTTMPYDTPTISDEIKNS